MSECSPGILWSVMPLELVLEGLAPEMPPRAEMAVANGVLVVEPQTDGSGTVVRLISSDPKDYLDPRYQPGSRIRMG